MVVINSEENKQEELDKLSENCPSEIYIQMITEMHYINFCDWKWLFRINGHVYDDRDIDYVNFIKLGLPYEEVVASFKIDLKNVSKNINKIEVALNEVGYHYEYPSKKIDKFNFHIFDISNDDFKIWSEFSFFNLGEKKKLHSKQIFVGTFAEVSNGWKFYPRMTDLMENDSFWLPTVPMYL